MADVLMFGDARPGRVLLVGTDGSTDRMPSLYKIAVGTELLENFRSDASHDVHVCDDIRRIAYFNTHLGDGRTEGTIQYGMTYIVRPLMEPVKSSVSRRLIRVRSFQLLLGPASSWVLEQIKVRSSTRATSTVVERT